MRKRAPVDETQRSFTKDHSIIVPLTVKDEGRPEMPRGNRVTVPDIPGSIPNRTMSTKEFTRGLIQCMNNAKKEFCGKPKPAGAK